MKSINFEWLKRLGKVVLIISVVLATLIPLGFFMEPDNDPVSVRLFYGAILLLVAYVSIIFISKVIMYIIEGKDFLKSIFDRKHYIIMITPIILILVTSTIFAFIIEPTSERVRDKELKSDYDSAIIDIGELKDETTICLNSAIDIVFKEEKRDCELLRGKTKGDYDFCVSLYSINTPAQCLYRYDYEIIKCSDEEIKKKSSAKARMSDMSLSCQNTVNKYKELNVIIEKYEKQQQ